MRMMIVFSVLFLAAMTLQNVDGCRVYPCGSYCRYSVGCLGGFCENNTHCRCYACSTTTRRSIQK
uniref:Defensin n=1 Tax=Ruditapes philippinarum TaxID=129788 RepID=J7FPX8_RUDPH|nr:defensin [Ruditapes philippinarum]AFP49966.1 defensin [Ruditapes philippinarum]AFP49973.1 defensin [Ruditapes philippinarum]AFP49975.1 defensin [Ruditapes philippinarum]